MLCGSPCRLEWGRGIRGAAPVVLPLPYLTAVAGRRCHLPPSCDAGGDGIMLWSLQKSGTPSAQALSTAVCNSLGLAGCADPLWP